MDADRWLRTLLDFEPDTYLTLERLTGPLGLDPAGPHRWGGSVFDLQTILTSVSITFDPFREDGPDPEIEMYRLGVRMPYAYVAAIMRDQLGEAEQVEVEGQSALRWGAWDVRANDDEVILDWTNRGPQEPDAPFDAAARDQFIAHLPHALAAAVTATDLKTATAPPPGSGIARRAQAAQVRLADASLIDATAPRVTLKLDPPLIAPDLARTWGIARPMAVSGDVHQQSWAMRIGGAEQGNQISTFDPQPGPWTLRMHLAARPQGPIPALSAGPSPAYDIFERGGQITAIEISPADPR